MRTCVATARIVKLGNDYISSSSEDEQNIPQGCFLPRLSMHARYEILSINNQDITGTPRILLQEDVRANQAVFGVNFDSRHGRYCLGPFAKGNAGNEDPNLCMPTWACPFRKNYDRLAANYRRAHNPFYYTD